MWDILILLAHFIFVEQSYLLFKQNNLFSTKVELDKIQFC